MGGAAIAALRLLKALKKQDVEIKMLVQKKKTDHNFIEQTSNNFINKQKNFFYFAYERLLFKLKEKDISVRFAFSMANIGEDISNHKFVKEADIIHLHWINFGFLSINSLQKLFKLDKPIVWTLHDMWSFTGGCHYAYDCKKYQTHCSNCSYYLKNSKDKDISHKVFENKINLFGDVNLNFATCSNWLGNTAKESKLISKYKITPINNAIETDVFKPLDKKTCREKLNIPTDKKIILFGAMNMSDERKGFKYLKEALNILKKMPNTDKILILLFGKSSEELLQELPFDYHNIKFTSSQDDILNIYNSADIYVIPSIQDNLPNTIVESHSCGVPVVGFDTAGISEMISHKNTGYLAKYKSSNDLATGIYWTLFNSNSQNISENARKYALENYSETIVANKYIDLYKNILKK